MQNILERIRKFLKGTGEVWSKLNLNQKVLIGGASLLLLIALFFLISGTNSKKGYEVLYSGLSEKDAAEIVAKLDEYKVNYQLEEQGNTILVPSDQKYKIRLNLAADNLPHGEAGFELFQESNFGETQTDKKVKYQRALQGELARTIQSLDKVKAAKVNLALPEPSLFSEYEELPKASVVIRTEDDDPLTSKEVRSIVNLVANSVERLPPENVVIVDQNGNLVSDNVAAGYIDTTDEVKMQLAIKRQYEKEKEAAIQTMLDKTLGKDNAVVRVNAELNFDDKQQVDEKYTHDPEGPFVRSEKIVKKSGTSTETAAAGVPGTDANIPQYAQNNAGSPASSYDESEKTRNYELNKTETVTRFSKGDVKYEHLTVSVLINNAIVDEVNLGETEEERIEKIRGIVATACGLKEDPENSNIDLADSISVAFIDFYTEPEPEPEKGSFVQNMMQQPYLPWLLAITALLIVLVAFVIMRRSRAVEEMPSLEEEKAGFEAVVEEEIKLEDLIDKNLTPEEKEKQKVRHEVEKLIDEHPEDAAQVIRAWLAEDER
ncbi:flagellar basal-body MS-ring/collar protein FliF [Thermosyntropha sp.]|uniref:flagellar basal-body MS-ring/collar protein FliF n=1 Tax=Thermosyntropha sp. TaxID=2740820 RepID=UPI0025F113B7|nr:flagellar basal-body MS-ring/collar protein FliF [Thermosyntropha sp.]MBO8159346.1 flagellar M-ring protein FliF [Thermosyntropha sp.]